MNEQNTLKNEENFPDCVSTQSRKKSSSMKTKRRNEIIFLCCIFALPILHKLTFYFGTAVQSVSLAFKSYNSDTGEYFYSGLVNFKEVFRDLSTSASLKLSLKNTVIFYIVDTFIGIPISLFCSYAVVKKVPGSGFIKVIFFLPSIISSVVMVMTFKYFCTYPLTDLILDWSGKTKLNLFQQQDTGYLMMIIYGMWAGFAGGLVLYLGAMTRVPDGVTDAAKIDGVSYLGEFWHVTLPTVYPTLTVFLVTGLVGIFTGGGPVYTFHQDDAPWHTYTMGYYLFTKVFGEKSDYAFHPYASALGVLITLIAAPLTFLLKYVLEHVGPQEE